MKCLEINGFNWQIIKSINMYYAFVSSWFYKVKYYTQVFTLLQKSMAKVDFFWQEKITA